MLQIVVLLQLALSLVRRHLPLSLNAPLEVSLLNHFLVLELLEFFVVSVDGVLHRLRDRISLKLVVVFLLLLPGVLDSDCRQHGATLHLCICLLV